MTAVWTFEAIPALAWPLLINLILCVLVMLVWIARWRRTNTHCSNFAHETQGVRPKISLRALLAISLVVPVLVGMIWNNVGAILPTSRIDPEVVERYMQFWLIVGAATFVAAVVARATSIRLIAVCVCLIATIACGLNFYILVQGWMSV